MKNRFKILFVMFSILISNFTYSEASRISTLRKNKKFYDEFHQILDLKLSPKTKWSLIKRNINECMEESEQLFDLEIKKQEAICAKEKQEINRLYKKLETCLVGYNFSSEFAYALLLTDKKNSSDKIGQAIQNPTNIFLLKKIDENFYPDPEEIILILAELNSGHGVKVEYAINYVIDNFKKIDPEEIFKGFYGKNWKKEAAVSDEIIKFLNSRKNIFKKAIGKIKDLLN